ncbi:MAG: hypothetical protein K0S12_2518, partial [Bacteroidetes bacterium]|nr:hypothetical protein [Bacteroidota bacterium]
MRIRNIITVFLLPLLMSLVGCRDFKEAQ